MFEMAVVGAVAKGFIFRKAAATKGNDLPATQTIIIAVPVRYFKIAFYFKGAVVVYSDLRFCHCGF